MLRCAAVATDKMEENVRDGAVRFESGEQALLSVWSHNKKRHQVTVSPGMALFIYNLSG